jgi:hypothetical protein
VDVVHKEHVVEVVTVVDVDVDEWTIWVLVVVGA